MESTPCRVIVLGSTGSIGRSSLEVLERLGGQCRVVGLAAQSSWNLLAEQTRRWEPAAVAIADKAHARELVGATNGVRVFSGDNALVELLDAVECDCVVAAVVGAVGLPAVLCAAQRKIRLALANKETMVIAGPLVTAKARKSGAQIIPIDSEHSGVFQALHAGHPAEVRKVYLTASGGPFRTWSADRMAHATLEDALNHPVWDMGPKNTIDSATMMNKALEVIEAQWLFGLHPDQIEVLVHPESVVHALVEFADGSVIAQMGAPDMRTPIQYALTYPQRVEGPARRLDIASLRRLNFEPPDPARFPSIRLAYEVARLGGVAGAVLNAANESAVELFRAGRIRFGEIVPLAEEVLSRHERTPAPTLDDLLAADRWARQEVDRCLNC